MGTFTLALDVRQCYAQGETITINADGSISPSTVTINTSDNVTYVFTGDISGGITVQRSDIVIDGNGFALKPESTNYYGLNLTNVDNVTITDATLDGSAVNENKPGFILIN